MNFSGCHNVVQPKKRELSTVSLFGKLREHELELNRLKEQESYEKKVKNIALKSNAQKKELNEEEENSYQDGTLNLLTKNFNRFLKKKNRERSQPKRRYNSKLNESSSTNFTCFGCGKPGYIKIDCPNNQNKDKKVSRKTEKSRGERAYISWEDNDMSSSSDTLAESEEANLYFMVNNEESSCDFVRICSTDLESYDQLLIAFKETHDESNRLVICNQLKSANNLLEPKVKSSEKELHDDKTKLVNLELMCLHASIKTIKIAKVLEKKVEYLMKTLSKLTMGRTNLETALGSQNVVFSKHGLWYKYGKKNNVKKLSSFFVPTKTKYSFCNSVKPVHLVSCSYRMVIHLGLVVRIEALKQEGGGVEGMKKVKEESQPKERKKTSYKTVLVEFQKFNRLFYQQNTKTTKSSLGFRVYKRVKGEKQSHKQFYTSSPLHQELHPIPKNY